MARLQFARSLIERSNVVVSHAAKSTAARIVAAAIVFCLALGAGLSYTMVRNVQNTQLSSLAELSNRASQTFSERFVRLNAEVLELAKQIPSVTAEVVAPPPAAAPPATEARPASSEVASASPRAMPVPLEVRWRRRLESSFRELADNREDVLDVTYLGRFSGVPNGRLMVVRVEREPDGELSTTDADPRPNWEASYLQRVIQSDGSVSTISSPVLVGDGDEARYAVMRGASPVRGSDGSVEGVVLISVELSPVLRQLETGLPEGVVPLLVSDTGSVLLHPTAELNRTSTESASEAIDAAYPNLLAAFEAQADTSALALVDDRFATRLLRFKVGGGASQVGFSLVVAATPARPELPGPEQLTEMFEAGSVLGGGRGWILGGVAGVIVLAGAAALTLRRRKQRAAALDESSEQAQPKASALEERANEIDAQNRVGEDEERAHASDSPDQLPDLSAESIDGSSEGSVAEEPAPESEEPEELEGSQVEVIEPPIVADECAETEQDDDRAEEISPAIAAASVESARELAGTRTRLEDELEVARRRALDELAAARERFECELARERERAIDRLVEISRKTLAGEGEELDLAASGAPALTIEEGEFDLRQLLTEVAAWMAGEFHGRGPGLEIRCNRNVPNRLLGDPEWMGPLLVNLGRNALRNNVDEPVVMSVSCVDDGAAAVRLCFELCASSTGLETDAAGSVRECQPSGLPLTEEIVESMHGRLEVDNRAGAGSTVRVVVPMSLPG